MRFKRGDWVAFREGTRAVPASEPGTVVKAVKFAEPDGSWVGYAYVLDYGGVEVRAQEDELDLVEEGPRAERAEP